MFEAKPRGLRGCFCYQDGVIFHIYRQVVAEIDSLGEKKSSTCNFLAICAKLITGFLVHWKFKNLVPALSFIWK